MLCGVELKSDYGKNECKFTPTPPDTNLILTFCSGSRFVTGVDGGRVPHVGKVGEQTVT
jgi:hypothetical protein